MKWSNGAEGVDKKGGVDKFLQHMDKGKLKFLVNEN